MTEKEMFLHFWEAEFPVTRKVFAAYPADQLDFKPHPVSRAARDLMWTVVSEEIGFVDGVVAGKIDFSNLPKVPDTLEVILKDYDRIHQEMVSKVKKMSDADFNATIKFYVAPKTLGDIRKAQGLWMMLMDQVHHRGQMTVYLRMTGGKVPSIYGPSADEPWQ